MNSIFEIRNCSCVEQNVDVIVNGASIDIGTQNFTHMI